MRLFAIGLLMVATTVCSSADDLVIRGGPARVHLLELFSSEGCSSCPPADESFARLVAKEKLWTHLVPVAWHVDYWDYLGWRDPFSSAEHSSRERAYAAAWHSGSVYTPCFVLNGKEWKSNADSPTASSAPGVLEARLKGADLQISYAPSAKPEKEREVWAALLSGEENSHVTAGENIGRDLKHLFVVKTTLHQKMKHSNETWTALLRLPKESTARALAVWVSGGIPEVEQAAGGWLPQR